MTALLPSVLGLVLAAWPFRGDVPPETVVARAAGPSGEIAITAERLAAYCAAHPQRPPREAAADLIEFELLAQEALKRGLASAGAVREAVALAAVPKLLKQDFEAGSAADTIPLDQLKRSYEQNINFFQRPELRVADHLLVSGPGFKTPTDPALDAAAQTLVQRVAEALDRDPPKDDAAFRAVAEKFAEDAKAAGLEIKAEQIPAFPRHGPYIDAFMAAAFALPAAGAIGTPLSTPFGYHLIRLREIQPPIDRSFEQALPELRARNLAEFRMGALKRRLEAASERIGIAINPEPLAPQEPRP